MSYKITLTKNAEKDYQIVKRSPYAKKVKELLTIIEQTPFEPPFEALSGNMDGLYSRRINLQHRLVYEINETTQTIKIRSMWTHYENI